MRVVYPEFYFSHFFVSIESIKSRNNRRSKLLLSSLFHQNGARRNRKYPGFFQRVHKERELSASSSLNVTVNRILLLRDSVCVIIIQQNLTSLKQKANYVWKGQVNSKSYTSRPSKLKKSDLKLKKQQNITTKNKSRSVKQKGSNHMFHFYICLYPKFCIWDHFFMFLLWFLRDFFPIFFLFLTWESYVRNKNP